MKLTLTFTNGADLTQVDKDDIYRTYFEFPDEILELPNAHEQVLHVINSIDLFTRAYLFVSCEELNWENKSIRYRDISEKLLQVDFVTSSKIKFHNRLARKRRDRYKTLTIRCGGFRNDIAGAYKLAEDIAQLLRCDGNPWEKKEVIAGFHDNRVVKMFNQRVSRRIKAEKKREREDAKKAKLEAEGKKRKKGRVYFIQQGKNGAIKIGYSTNPEKRLKTLSTASPYPLYMRLVIEGGKNLERDLHDKFAEYQLDGEWFEACTPLLEFIQNQQSDEI